MGKSVVYEGPSSRGDLSTVFIVKDEEGKAHRLVKDAPSPELPDKLAKELLDGSDRTEGHSFRALEKGEEPAPDPDAAEPAEDTGGAGGSGPATGDGTTAAAGR